jgi:transcription antitermination factor NusG
MSYWACAQLQPNRERLALHMLGLAGFETYAPRIRTRRAVLGRGRLLEGSAPLFLGYAFLLIHAAWYPARYSQGVIRLVLDGDHPARVSDSIITDLRRREVDGFVELPKARGLQRGDKLRVIHGALEGQLAIFEGMRPRERVEVLLTLLGTQRRVELARADVRLA